jgi:hypothetical protein
LTRCKHCGIFFITDRRNSKRRDLFCPFGCRETYRKQNSAKRSLEYYQGKVGKLKKQILNNKRSKKTIQTVAEPAPTPKEAARIAEPAPTPKEAARIAEPTPIPEKAASIAKPAPIPEGAARITEPAPISEQATRMAEPAPTPKVAARIAEPAPIPEGAARITEPAPIPEEATRITEPAPIPEEATRIAEPAPLEIGEMTAMHVEESLIAQNLLRSISRELIEHVQMVISLFERRKLSWNDICTLLNDVLRQHRLARRTRMDYIITHLNIHPP